MILLNENVQYNIYQSGLKKKEKLLQKSHQCNSVFLPCAVFSDLDWQEMILYEVV